MFNTPERKTLEELKETKLKDLTFQEVFDIIAGDKDRPKFSLLFGVMRKNWIANGLLDFNKDKLKERKNEFNRKDQ